MNKVVVAIIAFIVAVIIVFSVRNAESAEQPMTVHQTTSHRAAQAPVRVRQVVYAAAKNVHEEMVELVEKVPTKGSLKKTGDYDVDAHRSPVEIAEMSEVIGKVLDRAEEDNSFRPEALWFFEQCALKPKVLNSIGITCLHYLRKLAKETNTTIDLKRFPEKFVQKTDELLEMESQN